MFDRPVRSVCLGVFRSIATFGESGKALRAGGYALGPDEEATFDCLVSSPVRLVPDLDGPDSASISDSWTSLSAFEGLMSQSSALWLPRPVMSLDRRRLALPWISCRKGGNPHCDRGVDAGRGIDAVAEPDSRGDSSSWKNSVGRETPPVRLGNSHVSAGRCELRGQMLT